MFSNTHGAFCIALITGTPGAGKSFCTVRDVYTVLCESDRAIVTNLPINVDVLCEWVARDRPGKDLTASQVRERITILEPERLERWKRQEGGPWELFEEGLSKGIQLKDGSWSGADFILDECHLYCPATGDGRSEEVRILRKNWKSWLGEIRHEGWRRILFISQDEAKIGDQIQMHAELWYELTKGDRDRMPWVGIPFGDWYSLIASFTGVYWPRIVIAEYRRDNRKSKLIFAEAVRISPKYFPLYESYAHKGGGTGGGTVDRPKLEWEIRPTWWWGLVDDVRKAPTWFWFVNKYKFRVGFFSFCVGLGVWLTLLGGIGKVMAHAIQTVNRVTAGAIAMGPDKLKSKSPAPSAPQLLPGVEPLASPDQTGPDVSLPQQLMTTMAALSPDQRGPIQRVFEESAATIRGRDSEIEKLRSKLDLAETAALEAAAQTPLPVVTAFIGNSKIVVNGRTMKVGDSLLLDEGKTRVKIRKIDREERVVYLEDSRVIMFRVNESDLRVPELATPPVSTPPASHSDFVSPPVQSVGGAADGRGSSVPSPDEKSILIRKPDADSGVLPPG